MATRIRDAHAIALKKAAKRQKKGYSEASRSAVSIGETGCGVSTHLLAVVNYTTETGGPWLVLAKTSPVTYKTNAMLGLTLNSCMYW